MPSVAVTTSNGVVEIALDDGKMNSFTLEVIAAVNSALDNASKSSGAILLTGNAKALSAGFDIGIMGGPPCRAKLDLYMAGLELMAKIFAFPRPVIIASSGHALALGAILLLCGDLRIGARNPKAKIGLNEVAIGMTVPAAAVEAARHRLVAKWFPRATSQALVMDPETAAQAGFLDIVVEPADLLNRARAEARELGKLPHPVFERTKMRERGEIIKRMLETFKVDRVEWEAELSKSKL